MARTISIGEQGFEDIRERGNFYVDKTAFIREWYASDDKVTLICRPRRFGKTLNLDTVRCFLSTEFAGRGEELFAGLDVWEGGTEAERERMRALQGTVPVISLSFAAVKAPDYEGMLAGIRRVVRVAADAHAYLRDSPAVSDGDRALLGKVSDDMATDDLVDVVGRLCAMLRAHHGAKPVVLLDEYDAPMEVAWTGGYWDRAASLMRRIMNSTFKTNPALGKGLITGVTRTARESIFSDLNNLEVVTTSTGKYQTCFGFTQAEVDEALEEYGLCGERGDVRDWYDGFTFGGVGSIYNPWSITKFLDSGGTLDAYWANTSSNGLVSEVVRRGDEELKSDFEELLAGGTITKIVDEQVVFSELGTRGDAVWALLLAAGYVTAPGQPPESPKKAKRTLALTNQEVEVAFDRMVAGWFARAGGRYGLFARSILSGDARTATRCLADVTRSCISSFDAGTHASESEPERFYHGLVLGLLVELRGRYSVESNRESGLGRYDVALVPTDGASGTDPAVVIEFKVFDSEWDGEETLADTVARAYAQIEERSYVTGLVERGIAPERILTYGIAFRGKEVLVG